MATQSGYQIPGETLPDARPHLAVSAYVAVVLVIVASDLLAYLLMGFNAWALGCGDRKRQWGRFALAYGIALAIAIVAAELLVRGWQLGAGLMLEATLLPGLYATFHAHDRQQVLYDIQSDKGALIRSIAVGVGIFAVDLLIIRPAFGGNLVLRLLFGVD